MSASPFFFLPFLPLFLFSRIGRKQAVAASGEGTAVVGTAGSLHHTEAGGHGERRRRATLRGGWRPRRAKDGSRAEWRRRATLREGWQRQRAEDGGRGELRLAAAMLKLLPMPPPRAPSVPGCHVGMEEMGCVGPTIGHPNRVAKFG
uniref:Uncharacterized protein n=1 Tax=Oryza sativa subsp. japonica TaxID=39947 RepID=Q6K6R7_ORYSJ|nr:hypothetical protein [Oryza sativa Japonica Group]